MRVGRHFFARNGFVWLNKQTTTKQTRNKIFINRFWNVDNNINRVFVSGLTALNTAVSLSVVYLFTLKRVIVKLEIEWKQIEEEEDYFIRLVLVLKISEFLVKNKYEGEKKTTKQVRVCEIQVCLVRNLIIIIRRSKRICE